MVLCIRTLPPLAVWDSTFENVNKFQDMYIPENQLQLHNNCRDQHNLIIVTASLLR